MRPSDPSLRGVQILAACAVAAAAAGYFSGTRRTGPPEAEAQAARPGTDLPEAPTHAALAAGRWGDNRTRHAEALDRMRLGPADGTERDRPTPEQWAAALATRADRRAYDGAPPVIPHGVEPMGPPECLTCHEHGARVGARLAPAMSHEIMDSCTQCHVTAAGPVPGDGGALAASVSTDNGFVGARPAGAGGGRAWPGAPPVVPHPTFMRERCAACHGGLTDGLHSSHAGRQSCAQCHAPTAALEQGVPR